MKKNYIILIYITTIILYVSCVKPKDIPDTTTTIEGYVIDSLTRDSLPEINIAIFLSPLYQTQHWSSIDTIIKSDSTGHFTIQMNCDKYKEWAYMISSSYSKKYYEPKLKRINVGKENMINIEVLRQEDYTTVNGIISDIKNDNNIYNILITFLIINRFEKENFVKNEIYSDSTGYFFFDNFMSDTSIYYYAIYIPKSLNYQASDTFHVKYGIDNFYNIKLKPLK